jgi:predicted Rossmann fold nucleotide-binding protein DprA/Smf involved in DNA uptake
MVDIIESRKSRILKLLEREPMAYTKISILSKISIYHVQETLEILESEGKVLRTKKGRFEYWEDLK